MHRQTIDTYNKLAKEYDEETKSFWDKFPYVFFDKFKQSVENGKVLDVGSGPGRDALILKKEGFNVICLDASVAMVEMCKKNGLETVLADFLKIPFNDNTFDGVWAYTSLLHVSKKKIVNALMEIKRVLKPQGTLGLGMLEGEGEVIRDTKGVREPRLFTLYTQSELEKILEQNGFEVFYFKKFQPRTSIYLNFLAKNIK
jgi:ubiquinone/menaquinone biosynthesis C-methylase UbiE